MRRLHQKVNLIPVIAKADTLTEEEVSLFKQRVSFPLSPMIWCWWQILADIHHHGIRIFEPPAYENEDEETIQENEEIIVSHLLFYHWQSWSTEQSPIRSRRFRLCRTHHWRTTSPRASLPLGSHWSWQWITLWFRQAPSDARQDSYGGIEGTYQRCLVWELSIGKTQDDGCRAGWECFQGDQVSFSVLCLDQADK